METTQRKIQMKLVRAGSENPALGGPFLADLASVQYHKRLVQKGYLPKRAYFCQQVWLV